MLHAPLPAWSRVTPSQLMAIYEYSTSDGHIVERWFKMSEAPDRVILDDGREAVRIMSRPANMASRWVVTGTTSDLPDEGTRAP